MKVISSLFWQLYLSIIGAIILIGFCFIVITETRESDEGVDDFYRDVQQASVPILFSWDKRGLVPPGLIRLTDEEFNFFVEMVDRGKP